MTEKEEAVRLAHAVLEKPYIDPDGDISMLARQFLRAREEIDATRASLAETLRSLEYWYSRGKPYAVIAELANAAPDSAIGRARAVLNNFTVPQVETAREADAAKGRKG